MIFSWLNKAVSTGKSLVVCLDNHVFKNFNIDIIYFKIILK